jgi:hypothetical protein
VIRRIFHEICFIIWNLQDDSNLLYNSRKLRNVGGSTQMPVRAWNNARKGTWSLPSPVKLKRSHITYTVSVWWKTHSEKQLYIRAWNIARIGTWSLPPPVKLERSHMTYTVSVWQKTHSEKQLLVQYACSYFGANM